MNASQAHPYDYFAALKRLRDSKHELDADELARLKMIVALNASDPEAVSLVANLSGDDWANIYPPVPKEAPISTGQAIDIFLGTYGNTSPNEEAVLEKLIFNPVPDYSTVLEQQENENDTDDIAAISALAKSINGIDGSEETSEDVAEGNAPRKNTVKGDSRKEAPQTPMTLELAKIFVKQGRFDRAHEIISKIILNNPEKSVYFADQLRFLEKLIKIKQAQSGSRAAIK